MSSPFDAAIAAAQLTVRNVMGRAIVYTASGHAPVTVSGVFDAAFQSVEPGEYPGVASVGPAVLLRRADLPVDPAAGHGVAIDGVAYRVHEPHPDGRGMVTCLLHKV